MFAIDREKYIRLMKTEGHNAALTALHRDVERWEFETFEGRDGYRPDIWNELLHVRDFSRELWDLSSEKV